MSVPHTITEIAAPMFFYLVGVDGLTSRTDQAGEQPQVSKNGASWINDGIGILVHIGNGHYYASTDLTNVTLSAAIGDSIVGRYKSGVTIEAPSLNEMLVVDPLSYGRLVEGDPAIIVGPLIGTSSVENFVGNPLHIALFRAEAKTFLLIVLDTDSIPVDLSGMDLRFVVESTADNPIALITIEEPAITVTGSSDEIANVPLTSGESDFADGLYEWRLWDNASDTVLLYGPFTVLPTSE